jgi:phosphatidylinositol phospholipase C delta
MASRYVEDLYRGIRCIELDTHDGSQGPIIKHGYTITSAITFKSVIEAINEFSVLNPKHFPIILSLENHCGINNQIVMATIIEQTLKDRLFVIPRICSNKDRLPSPNQLRGKVIIQGTGNIEEMRPSYRKEQLLVNARTGRLQRTTKFVPKSLDYPPEFLQKKANFKAYRAGLNSRK